MERILPEKQQKSFKKRLVKLAKRTKIFQKKNKTKTKNMVLKFRTMYNISKEEKNQKVEAWP